MLPPAKQSLPVIDEWLQAVPGLRKQSTGRWAGPCPACGGKDRFHVEMNAGGRVLWGCRGCLDGANNRRSATRKILEAAFPNQRIGRVHSDGLGTITRSREVGEQHARVENQPRADAAAMARLVWAGILRAEASPAAHYLAERRIWPGDDPLEDIPVPLPDSLGWLPRNRLPRGYGYGLPVMPPGAEGALAFRYEATDGSVRAVALEALDARGARLRPKRWRRTVGARTGATFRCGSPGGSPLVVAEGELDALAASWLHGPEAECLALGGTSGLAGWRPDANDARPVVVECDGDVPGVVAAIRIERRLQRMGRTVSMRWRAPGEGDTADELAAQVRSAGWAAVAGIE